MNKSETIKVLPIVRELDAGLVVVEIDPDKKYAVMRKNSDGFFEIRQRHFFKTIADAIAYVDLPTCPTGMEFAEFIIGKTFFTATGLWICTDIGTRVVVAKQDGGDEEVVFDENDFGGCSTGPFRGD